MIEFIQKSENEIDVLINKKHWGSFLNEEIDRDINEHFHSGRWEITPTLSGSNNWFMIDYGGRKLQFGDGFRFIKKEIPEGAVNENYSVMELFKELLKISDKGIPLKVKMFSQK